MDNTKVPFAVLEKEMLIGKVLLVVFERAFLRRRVLGISSWNSVSVRLSVGVG